MTERDWIQLGIWLLTIVAFAGTWRGRREAAEAAAHKAIESMGELVDQRFQALEDRIVKLDQDRRADFDRLHAKADKAQSTIAENWRQAQKDFVSRSEHDQVLHNVRVLEHRVNTYFEARK